MIEMSITWVLLGYTLKRKWKWLSGKWIIFLFFSSIPYTVLYIIFYNQINAFLGAP